MSSWVTLSNNNDLLNKIQVKTNFSGHQPSSISFICSRNQPISNDPNRIYINADVFNVFRNAVLGKSDEDMVGNPGQCSEKGKRHCGNVRQYLWECGCDDLNRKLNKFYRLHFENDVISSIVNSQKIVNAQNAQTPFQFNLAMFCSGGLLGEEILLFRLINELRNREMSGTINLFLIDWEYKSAINRGNPDGLIDQFLREVCGSLPPSIKVNGTFFGDDDDYIQMVQVNSQFKHDLLIGADPEGAEKLMGKISQRASIFFEQAPIVLIRSNRGPSICRINLMGEQENCYQPYPTNVQRPIPTPQNQPKVQKPNPQFSSGVVVSGAIALVALIIMVIALIHINKAKL